MSRCTILAALLLGAPLAHAQMDCDEHFARHEAMVHEAMVADSKKMSTDGRSKAYAMIADAHEKCRAGDHDAAKRAYWETAEYIKEEQDRS